MQADILVKQLIHQNYGLNDYMTQSLHNVILQNHSSSVSQSNVSYNKQVLFFWADLLKNSVEIPSFYYQRLNCINEVPPTVYNVLK